ncbi:acyl-CoA dehydrogenase [Alphaproteobacteria bacterium]|jgi:alkylation response protein AidB-like acyl-CoA dehydrogenase|nr:acyl-CoA dehydrogenase [Alphaproteobacteria bacterium]MDA9054472.1 acyl-CoA dehydrogenase [Alphaproteobacteria bacterium]MDB0013557.1 acyl-CoA dehydrogenase [Alphaproteobacteria bacterium]
MYKAPLEDYQFVLDRVIGFDALMTRIGNDEVNQELADAVLEEAGKLAGDVIAPLNHSGDITGAKRQDDGQVITPDGFRDAYAAMGQGGWTAMEAAEDFGGQNLPMTLTTAVNELWQSANMAFALCHLLTQGQIYALQKSASPELQNIFIPPMVEGRWTGTMNLTEPQAGTDLAGIKSRAVPNGDHYLISGQKIYITYGEHDMAENIVHLVLARTPDAPDGIKGISVFIVPKFLADDAGNFTKPNDLRCLSIEKKLGIKGSPTAVMQYGETDGAVGYLVGQENQGIDIMFGMMNHARLAVGLQGLAISERAYQQARTYARDRVQGVPLDGKKGDAIVHHPDVLRLLGAMKAEIEAMRALMMIGAAAMDKARHASESEKPDLDARVGLLIPVIKGWMTERAQQITSDALQIHGGMGFIEETGAAQHYRDARILPIYEGTTAIQANDLVFRKTIRDNGAAVTSLFDEIDHDMAALETHPNAAISAAAKSVIEASKTARIATANIIGSANSPRRPAAAASNYLMLLGTLSGGWLMARAGAAAADAIASGETGTIGNDDFMTIKITTMQIYLTHHLPKLFALARTIADGDAPVLAMKPDWL